MVKKVDGKRSFNWLFAVFITYLLFFIFSYSYFNIAGYAINEGESFAFNAESNIVMTILFLVVFFIFSIIVFVACFFVYRHRSKIKPKSIKKKRTYSPFNY